MSGIGTVSSLKDDHAPEGTPRAVILNPALAQRAILVVVTALAAMGVHVDPARPLHLLHIVDQILDSVALVAPLGLAAVAQPPLAPRRLGDGLRLRFLILLFGG